MPPDPEELTIPVTPGTKKDLNALRGPDETYDRLIARLVQLARNTPGFAMENEEHQVEYASLNDDPEYRALKKEMAKQLGFLK